MDEASLEEEEEEDDDTDGSYEKAGRKAVATAAGSSLHHNQRPSSSSSSSIQSNKVDSSGLNATPPHQKEQPEFEQLRGGESADDSLELDTSNYLDTSRNSEEGAAIEDSEDEEEEETDPREQQQQDQQEELSEQQLLPQQQQQQQQQHVSSSVKKKKKKSADDYLAEQSILYDDDDSSGTPSPPAAHEESREFQPGDLVWGPLQGFPSWPGKVVQHGDREGAVWVCWYGGRQLTQVDRKALKTLSEGLDAHHKERKKLRKGRRMNTSLEKAIQEAMSELD